ncbi:hypothetical protein M404DRAFT_31397 [Pisolithus tinctorius Marx 270]|uniref:F-box domain-containing protein n=1 Tax=Pisolithus tinctorius Marx 270 TaxID=870435 RepID=A0A0C3NT42_PISTI|nr:hypothetical protein M404DRAFT_31397 [Pisolithus tinctorius Marx 270]
MDFTGHSKDWVVTMLDRSTPHVFDIGWEHCFNLESDVRRITNHLCHAIRFLHRVHEVHLYAPPGSITGVMTCCPSSAPYLETIVLISSEDEGTDQVTELPAQIFELHAPHLRTLHIGGLRMQWGRLDACNFQNLRHFEIYHLPESSRPSLEVVMTILMQLPCLKNLVLCEALQDSILRNHLTHHFFPCHTTLVLEAPVAHTVCLLEAVDVSHLKTLKVFARTFHMQTDSTDLARFFSLIRTKVQSTTYCMMQIYCDEESVHMVGLPKMFLHDEASGDQRIFMLFAEWTRSGFATVDGAVAANAFMRLWYHLSSPCVQSLHCQISPYWNDRVAPATWPEILAWYPAVEHVSIFGMPPSGLLEALLWRPDSASSSTILHTPALPRLSSIHLKSIPSPHVLGEHLMRPPMPPAAATL